MLLNCIHDIMQTILSVKSVKVFSALFFKLKISYRAKNCFYWKLLYRFNAKSFFIYMKK